MIVDDDVDIRELIVEVLTDEGYDAVAMANGQEALNYLRQGSGLPALILLDLMMPVMAGREFLAEQMKDPSLASIPVVLLTAGNQANAIPSTASLKKPVGMQTLLEVIERHTQ